MKKFIVLFFLIAPFTSFSQSQDSVKTKKFAIGLVFSPDYCYRTLKPDASSAAQYAASYRNGNELSKFGLTTGLGFLFHMNRRLTFETGIFYSDKGEKSKDIDLGPPGQDPLIGQSMNATWHYRYLDIPVQINYFLLTKRFKLFVTGGVSMNIFLSEKVTQHMNFSDGHTTTTTNTVLNPGFIPLNFAAVAGLGASYDLNKHFTLRLEPVFRHSITTIIDAPVKGFLYSAGLNTGLYYQF
jgi:opacity protein-like surface antigen